MEGFTVELNEQAKELLGNAALEPKVLWKWFLWAAAIPRGSGHCERMRDALLSVGRAMGLPTRTDAVGNVCITRPATPGYESAPGVVVQCHYDMVVVHDDALRPGFDASTDAIVPELRGTDGWLYARGTSLGADDGVGVATCLALLEGSAPRHPRIDALFTVDEETTMAGADGVRPPLLSSPCARFLVNVDSEDDRMLCLGSAGGEELRVRCALPRTPTDAASEHALSVAVGGFRGGHTGVEIHKYRANAVKVLAQLLVAGCGRGCRLATLAGGQFSNAIPNSARATVVVGGDVAKVREAVLLAFEGVRADYAGIEDTAALRIEVADAPLPATALGAEDTRRVFDFWALAPCEPLRMSQELEGFVESSCSFSIAKLDESGIEFEGLARTSRDSQWASIDRRMEALAAIVGGKLEIFDKFSGWQPQPHSTLAKVAESAHQAVTGAACTVYSVHAGLECGIIMTHVPGLEAVSIGPKIECPHTTQERCKLSTVTEYWQWLVKILNDLN